MGFDPNEPRDSRGRWSRMNSTTRAQLTSRATFKGTTQSAGAMRGRAGDTGGRAKPGKVIGDERLVSHYQSNTVEKRKGGGRFQDTGRSIGPKTLRDQPKELNFFAREESSAAVAIQTAKPLDKDFRAARDKANKEAMKAALAKSSVPVVKYPPQKPKR